MPNAADLPLQQWRVLITRPQPMADQLIQAMQSSIGLQAIAFPCLTLEPIELDQEMKNLALNLDRYTHLIAVSTSAAELGLEHLSNYWPQWPIGVQCFGIGAATAKVFEHYQLEAQFPDDPRSEGLLNLLVPFNDCTAEQRILILRGDGGREWLGDTLRERGAVVDYLQVYRRQRPTLETLPKLTPTEAINIIIVTSSNILHNLLYLSAQQGWDSKETPLLVPSARIAEEAISHGYKTAYVSEGADDQAIITALKRINTTRLEPYAANTSGWK